MDYVLKYNIFLCIGITYNLELNAKIKYNILKNMNKC